MDLEGRNVMYHLKPLLEPYTEDQFQNCTSMYKMKNLMTCSTADTTCNPQADRSDASVETDYDVVKRQEKLLANLHRLQEDVSNFSKKLKQLESNHTAPKVNCSELFDRAKVRDFVINADPSQPPYVLLWLSKLWEIPLNITIHKHSSVQSLPKNLSVFDKLKSGSISDHSIQMTLVWKKLDGDVQLIVSPTKYKTVAGEVNVIRFFDYILNPDENVLQQIRKNEVFDLVHRLSHALNGDQQSILMELQERLGNETWMSGSIPTTTDAVTWSALVRLKKNSLPESLRRYVASCSDFVGVSISS